MIDEGADPPSRFGQVAQIGIRQRRFGEIGGRAIGEPGMGGAVRRDAPREVGGRFGARPHPRGLHGGDPVEFGIDGADPLPQLHDLAFRHGDGTAADVGPAFLHDGLDFPDCTLDLLQPLPLVRQDRDGERAHLLGQLVAQHGQRGFPA